MNAVSQHKTSNLIKIYQQSFIVNTNSAINEIENSKISELKQNERKIK